MITIRFTCSRTDKCDRTVSVVVPAGHYAADYTLRSYVPRGWHVHTPRVGAVEDQIGAAALAYCPQHTEEMR